MHTYQNPGVASAQFHLFVLRVPLLLLALLRTHWRLLALATGLALAASAGAALWQAHRTQATLAAQAAHQAAAAAQRHRADSTAAYEAGRLAELRRQATLLAHADEVLTQRRPAAVRLPAHPPRERPGPPTGGAAR